MDQPASGVVLHTVILDSCGIRELAAFYGSGFELGEATPTGDNHLGFALPNLYLGFDLVQPEGKSGPGPVSLWFEVPDLEATFERFLGMGAEIRYRPCRKPWGAVLAAIYDPEGNIVGLAQRGTIPA